MDPMSEKTPKPALFLHIQKTAGTSIVQLAAKYYGNTNVASHGDYVGKNPQDFIGVGFVSGHFGYNFAEQLMPGRYSFVFLRNPVERILSFYYFCRTRNPSELPIYRLAHKLTLEDFLAASTENELIKRRVWNSQVWRLASGPGPGSSRVDDMPMNDMLNRAMENIENFSYVGFTETFETDFQVIMRELNFPPNCLPLRENVTHGRATAADHPSSTIRMIENLTQLDCRLYDVFWQKRTSTNTKIVGELRP
jgi:hypothetical protein